MILENSDQEVIVVTPDPYSEDVIVDVVIGSQSVLSVNGQVGHVVINTSGITGVDLSNYYTRDNPSGYITGVNLSNYVTKISGQFLNRPTVNGTGVLLSGDIVGGGTANFRYFPTSGVANLFSNNRYSFDTLTGLVTGILPASPQKGDEIELYDSAGSWHLNPLIVDNNGNYIEQKKEMLECNVRHGLIKLIYTTQNNIGWRIYPMPIHNIPLFLPPSIAITGASVSGIVPFAITLTGVNLLDPAQAPVDEWYWNLNTGDGYAVSGQTIAYTYLETGLYDVTLSGSNAAGFDVEHRIINVFLPYIPTVNVTSNKLSGLAPFTGQLGAINTTQPAEFSPVDNWYWDFDSDAIFDATGQNTTVVYNTTGTYTPTAYGVNLGGTGTGFITINVIPPLPPIPAISTSSISGFAPLTLSFTGVNLQTPAEFSPVDHWYWDVSGDSAPEFDQRVITYTFNETGNYTFYLTAVNAGGSGVASGTFSILEIPQIPTGADPYLDYVTLLLHFNP
jgi:PKD repeat protein